MEELEMTNEQYRDAKRLAQIEILTEILEELNEEDEAVAVIKAKLKVLSKPDRE